MDQELPTFRGARRNPRVSVASRDRRVECDLSDHDALALWLGSDSDSKAIEGVLDEIQNAYADRAMDGFVEGRFGLEDRLASYLDTGLSSRVGTNVFELGSNVARVHMWLSETLDRFRLADIDRRRKHGSLPPASVDEISRPPRQYEVCDCGTIIKKSRPRANEYCANCKRADTRWAVPPTTDWADHILDISIIWRDGFKHMRFIANCGDCGSEFDYEKTTRNGQPRKRCDHCKPKGNT